MLAFFGKSVRHIDELPPAVGQAVGADRLHVPSAKAACRDRSPIISKILTPVSSL
jgi:hypothetical protein